MTDDGPTVTVLCGGFGAARFLTGLLPLVGDRLTCVVNTADDLEHLGLHVSPDVDTVCYALAGRFDEDRGFGLVGDTFGAMAALDQLGGPAWFGLGDLDLATHFRRTQLLADGATLTEATAVLAPALGVPAGVRVLPMSDDQVRTTVETPDGRLAFQDYLVKRRAGPQVLGVHADGVHAAQPAPGVLEALAAADLVVIAPSNPVSSVEPILALPGVRDAIQLRRRATIAVTPVVCGIPPSTAAEAGRAKVRAAFLAARGLDHTASAVAGLYQDLAGAFVLDERDAAEERAIRALGFEVILADTLAPPGPGRVDLARRVCAVDHVV